MTNPENITAARTQVLQFGDTLLGAPRSDAGPRIRDGATIDHYVVLDVLGVGAMGEVYLALDVELDRNVAIKVLHAGRAPSGLRDLRGEALALAQLSHPNVVAIHDVVSEGDELYLIMEYVPGRTLDDYLAELPRDWRSVVAVFLDAGRGLAAAHAAGLVHRDFKPANVMVSVDDEVKVMDFGIASAARDGSDADTQGGSAGVGTPLFMAPEQWRGAAVDARADVFAFCAAMWHALFGERPFAGRSLDELRASVCAGTIAPPRAPKRAPTWLRRALERGLACDPAARWPTIDALLRELGRDRRARRRRLYAGASLALLGATVLGLAAPEAVETIERESRLAACQVESEAIEGYFGTAQRLAILRALPDPLTPVAVAAAEDALTVLDSAATYWHFHRRETCLERGDSLLHGAWRRPLVDRCFERGAEELGLRAAAIAAGTEVAPLHNDALTRPLEQTSCRSLAELVTFAAPLPTAAAEREAWRQLRRDHLRLTSDDTLGAPTEATAALERLVADAAARGFVDVEADAAKLLARREFAAGRRLAARGRARRQLSAGEGLEVATRLGILEGGADGIDLIPAIDSDVRAPRRAAEASPLARLAGASNMGLDLETVPLVWGDAWSERPLTWRVSRGITGRLAMFEASARLLIRVGDDARAEAFALKALETLAEWRVVDPVLTLSLRRSAGVALARRGAYDAAAEHLRAAAVLAASSPIAASARGALDLALADLALRRGDLDEARAQLTQAGALLNAASAEDDLFASDLELARGRLRLRQGDLDGALPHLLAARRMLAASWGAARITLADTNAALARVALAQVRLDEAETYVVEATQLRRELVGDDHVSLAPLYRQRAAIARARGEVADADRFDALAAGLLDAEAALHRERDAACGRLRELTSRDVRDAEALQAYEACVATGVGGPDLAFVGIRVLSANGK
ncbi:MAG: protein kinase [Nannocystaceae bacterium]